MDPHDIRSPAQLRATLAVVKKGVADGELREVSNYGSAPDGVERVPLDRLLDPTIAWPDVLRVELECPACRQRFSLSCETYHGSGGRWST